MIGIMKQRLITWAGALIVLISMASPALARRDEPEHEIVDARLENYDRNVTLEGGGTSLLWVLFVLLGALCAGVMFKDAKRSHLD